MKITIPPTEIEEAAKEYSLQFDDYKTIDSNDSMREAAIDDFISGATFATTKINQTISPVIMEAVEVLNYSVLTIQNLSGAVPIKDLDERIGYLQSAINKLKALSKESNNKF